MRTHIATVRIDSNRGRTDSEDRQCSRDDTLFYSEDATVRTDSAKGRMLSKCYLLLTATLACHPPHHCYHHVDDAGVWGRHESPAAAAVLDRDM